LSRALTSCSCGDFQRFNRQSRGEGLRLGFVMNIDEPDPAGIGDLPDREIRTDAAGRFTVAGFAPGLRYNLAAVEATRVLARLTSGGAVQGRGSEVPGRSRAEAPE